MSDVEIISCVRTFGVALSVLEARFLRVAVCTVGEPEEVRLAFITVFPLKLGVAVALERGGDVSKTVAKHCAAVLALAGIHIDKIFNKRKCEDNCKMDHVAAHIQPTCPQNQRRICRRRPHSHRH
jgi:hypothetical protein